MRPSHPEPFGPRWRGRWIWHRRPAIRAETATRPVSTIRSTRSPCSVARSSSTPYPTARRVPTVGRRALRPRGQRVPRWPGDRSDRIPDGPTTTSSTSPGVLRSGTNVLAVTARHFGEATSWWTPVPPTYSLGAGCLVFEAAVDDDWVVSDRSWSCAPGDAWSPVPVPGDVACLPLESFDATRHPAGWESRRIRRRRMAPCRRDGAGPHRGHGAIPARPASRSGCCAPRSAGRSPAGRGTPPRPTGPGPVRRRAGRRPGAPGPRRRACRCGHRRGRRRARAPSTSAGSPPAPSSSRSPGAERGTRCRRGRGRAPRRRRRPGPPRPARRLPLRLPWRGTRAVRDVRRARGPVPARQRAHGRRTRSPRSPCRSRTATDPGPTGPRSPARTPARADPRRRPAHRRPLRARRLRRLPDPRAARLDRGLGRPPDGRPRRQPRLVDGPLAPRARRLGPRPTACWPWRPPRTSGPTTGRSSPTGRSTGCARSTTSTATRATANWSASCCPSPSGRCGGSRPTSAPTACCTTCRDGCCSTGRASTPQGRRRRSTRCGPAPSRTSPTWRRGSGTRARRRGPAPAYAGVRDAFDAFYDPGRGVYVDHVVDGVRRRRGGPARRRGRAGRRPRSRRAPGPGHRPADRPVAPGPPLVGHGLGDGATGTRRLRRTW